MNHEVQDSTKMQSLSRPERQLLIMRYYDGLTMKEIAAVFDIHEQVVRQTLRAVVKRLYAGEMQG